MVKLFYNLQQKALTETYIFISEVEFVLLYQVTTWRTTRKIILTSASCNIHLESLLVINNNNNKTLTSHDKQQHLYHSTFQILFAS